MFGTVLTVISIVLQAFGLVAAAAGLFKTFKSSSAPGDRFFRAVLATELDAVRQIWAALMGFLRRLLRRPRPPVTHTISAALSAESAVSLQGFLQFGPLPDATQDPAAFGAEIQRRLNLVYRLAQDVQGELKQEEKARQAGDQQASETLSARIAALDEESKRAAIRGLREQVIGFFFVALGLVVQSIVDLVF